jgi:hypothetical protein
VACGRRGLGAGIEAPFEHVPLDVQRAGDAALGQPLCVRADVDQDRAFAPRGTGRYRVQAAQALPGGVDDLLDRAPVAACRGLSCPRGYHDRSSPVVRRMPSAMV